MNDDLFDPVVFGTALRTLREAAGITRHALARQANLSIPTVRDMERGRHHVAYANRQLVLAELYLALLRRSEPSS